MISIFDLFKIGIGPSSSHTVGPMKAAAAFANALRADTALAPISRLGVRLFGSLACTGKGHCTDKAVALGLAGHLPEAIDPDEADRLWEAARTTKRLLLPDGRECDFDPVLDIVFETAITLPRHPNALEFVASDIGGNVLAKQVWYSVGGGFIVREGDDEAPSSERTVPYPFRSGAELLAMCGTNGYSIAQLVFENELALRSREAIEAHIGRVSATMFACIDNGIQAEGILPGGLKVPRRARNLYRRVKEERAKAGPPHDAMEYVSIYAIAVNEENAAGRRVVTAPTNGGAGVVPAVLRYYRDHCGGATDAGISTYLLTATAIGGLYKMNASISAAEVGCQGEIGVACSMAAGGLAAALGGTNEQVENAAEIGMEHHLGMTCDPIGGLVQIPCIERNAFGAVGAVNAALLALRGDGIHHVSLDQVITAMHETGKDMQAKYKETARGGLAVSVPNC